MCNKVEAQNSISILTRHSCQAGYHAQLKVHIKYIFIVNCGKGAGYIQNNPQRRRLL